MIIGDTWGDEVVKDEGKWGENRTDQRLIGEYLEWQIIKYPDDWDLFVTYGRTYYYYSTKRDLALKAHKAGTAGASELRSTVVSPDQRLINATQDARLGTVGLGLVHVYLDEQSTRM